MQIRVLEDESTLSDLIARYLIREGYETDVYLCGEDALRALDLPCDLWIIDIMLPDMDGYSFFKEVKKRLPQCFTFFISARNQDIDRVVGLELGCDDYIPKPFLMRELVLRVNKLFQRESPRDSSILIPPYRINPGKHSVSLGTEIIPLTLKEFDLLHYLALNSKQILARETILDTIWGDDYYGSDRVVDDTVRRLRKKLPELDIETVYGFGYCLRNCSK